MLAGLRWQLEEGVLREFVDRQLPLQLISMHPNVHLRSVSLQSHGEFACLPINKKLKNCTPSGLMTGWYPICVYLSVL